jgi:hypothetical protein
VKTSNLTKPSAIYGRPRVVFIWVSHFIPPDTSSVYKTSSPQDSGFSPCRMLSTQWLTGAVMLMARRSVPLASFSTRLRAQSWNVPMKPSRTLRWKQGWSKRLWCLHFRPAIWICAYTNERTMGKSLTRERKEKGDKSIEGVWKWRQKRKGRTRSEGNTERGQEPRYLASTVNLLRWWTFLCRQTAYSCPCS